MSHTPTTVLAVAIAIAMLRRLAWALQPYHAVVSDHHADCTAAYSLELVLNSLF